MKGCDFMKFNSPYADPLFYSRELPYYERRLLAMASELISLTDYYGHDSIITRQRYDEFYGYISALADLEVITFDMFELLSHYSTWLIQEVHFVPLVKQEEQDRLEDFMKNCVIPF